jgi:polysaccharide pyruvyl transferase WcaK-like protein
MMVCDEDLSLKAKLNVAVTPRRWFHYGHYLLPAYLRRKFISLDRREHFEELKMNIACVCDELAAEYQARIVFIPMKKTNERFDPGQDDDKACQEILSCMRSKEKASILQGDYAPGDLMAFIGEMDLIMGMRMHSLIMGCLMGIPVIGLSISPKFLPFFESIKQEEYLIDVNEVKATLLLDKIKKAIADKERIKCEMRLGMEKLKKRALSNAAYARGFFG